MNTWRWHSTFKSTRQKQRPALRGFVLEHDLNQAAASQ